MIPGPLWPLSMFRIAWCFECGSLSEAESLMQPERLLKFHKYMTKHREQIDPPGFAGQEIRNRQFVADIQHMTLRRSPARCLRCTSTNIIKYPKGVPESQGYGHLGCGGHFKYVESECVSIFFKEIYLTVEGLEYSKLNYFEKMREKVLLSVYSILIFLLSGTGYFDKYAT